MAKLIIICGLLACFMQVFGQRGDTLVIENLEQVLELAIQHNSALKMAKSVEQEARQREGAISDIGKTGIYHSYDANNLAPNDRAVRVYGIYQKLPFPTTFARRSDLYQRRIEQASSGYDLEVWRLKEAISKSYYSLIFYQNLLHHHIYLDSIFLAFSSAADKRYEVGESTYLEKISARNKFQQQRIIKDQGLETVTMAYNRLAGLVQAGRPIVVTKVEMEKLEWPQDATQVPPGQETLNAGINVAKAQWSVSRSNSLPDITLEYFRGFGIGENRQNFNGYMIGLEVPIWFKPYHKRNQAMKIRTDQALFDRADYEVRLIAKRRELQAELQKYETSINYFENEGLPLAGEIQMAATKSYYEGEIGYMNYIQSLEEVARSHIQYLDDLNNYNQTYISLYYLTEIN